MTRDVRLRNGGAFLRLVARGLTIAAFSCGLAGCAVKTANVQAITDALTAARVRTALVNDPQLGLRLVDVRVTAGVAHVSAAGVTEEEAERLQQIILAVAGVSEVAATVETAAPRDPALAPPMLRRIKRQ